jgi:hypothetical protein
MVVMSSAWASLAVEGRPVASSSGEAYELVISLRSCGMEWSGV